MTGELIWKRDLAKEFEIPNYFFGKGSNPIVFKETLIVNVGGSKNRCVVGFNIKTGKTDWITYDSWGASYSSPTLSKINDKQVCLVFTGGESRPPTGGLIVIDPENGKKLSRYPWRSSNTNLRMPYLQFHCQEIKFFYLNAMKKEVSS